MKKVLVIAASLLTLCIAAALGYGIYFNINQNRDIADQNKDIADKLEKKIESDEKDKQEALRKEREAELKKAEEDNKVEDTENVTIGSRYQLIDTSHIAKAYLENKPESLTDPKDKETYEEAVKIQKDIIKPGMTDYQKELAVYEWLVKNVKFNMDSTLAVGDYASFPDRPYGVLHTKNAVCAGFASTFRLFMQMNKIECKVVHDTECSHSWDLVKLDGDWYHVDCTFDAGQGNSYYKNFNLCDKTFMGSHTWDTSLFPAANGTKYTYAIMNSEKTDDELKLPAIVKDMLNKDIHRKFLRFSDLKNAQMVTYIISKINERIPNTYLDSCYYTVDDKDYVVGLFIGYNTTDDDQGLTEQQLEKIEETVTKYFGEYVDYYKPVG